MTRTKWFVAAGAAVVLPLTVAAFEGAAALGVAPGMSALSGDPQKAAVEARDARWHQQLQADAADPVKAKAAVAAKHAAAPPAAAAAARWPEGIFQDGEAPASGSDFLGTSRWVGTVAGRSVAVYAGQAGADDTTGRLLVTTAGPAMTLDSAYTRDLSGSGALSLDPWIGLGGSWFPVGVGMRKVPSELG